MAALANSVFNRLEDLPVPTIAAVTAMRWAVAANACWRPIIVWRAGSAHRSAGNQTGHHAGLWRSVRMPRMLGADSALEIIAAVKMSARIRR